ncbi:MAG: 16S rRNA (adenine(1518)-N(6)/adenine(1519)-N(6))-dimethyltransferase RsmA [Eubacteriales bacterium]
MKVYSPKVVNELLKRYSLSPQKRFSQNFLVDENTLVKIANAAPLNSYIIEIGPGLGALTLLLAKRSKKVLAYEIDRGLFEALHMILENENNVFVKNEDALKADFLADAKEHFGDNDFFVVANLPYNITTPIIMRFLEENLPVSGMVLMMQKEVAQRICNEGDKSALTIAVSFYSKAHILFNVSKNSFLPKPEVDSSVVNFDIVNREFEFKKEFFEITRALFAMKRKTVENNFASAFRVKKDVASTFFKDLDLNPSYRAQQFSTEDFLKMAKNLKNFLKNY